VVYIAVTSKEKKNRFAFVDDNVVYHFIEITKERQVKNFTIATDFHTPTSLTLG